MKNFTLIVVAALALMACSPTKQKAEQILTIDSTLQTKATSILENKLLELNAPSGQVIIMEVQTGQIKALVRLERKDSTNYQSCENFAQAHESGLMHTISILTALETGKVKLSDIVNTGNGIYLVNGVPLKDHNWHRGGYGEISIKQGLEVNSNIATYKTLVNAFGDNAQAYFDSLDKMNYGKPDSIAGIDNLKPVYFVTPKNEDWSGTTFAWFCIGYNQRIAPIQMLTFYNAIANNGKMVQPQVYQGETIVINSQIANKTNIDSLRETLVTAVYEGLTKPAASEKVKVAGKSATTRLLTKNNLEESYESALFAAEFCGYFPADNPRFSIIVSINKEGLPANGGLMAGAVFRQIVDSMVAE